MARPKKSRKVCKLPESNSFSPNGNGLKSEENITMSVDEYEAIRLIDYVEYTQEECAKKMGIARTTVQMIYNDGRKKIADALVNGKNLVIEGGKIDLCNKENPECCMKNNFQCCKENK